MQIQVRHDDHIKGSERLQETVTATLESALERFRGQISRVDVHLKDENGPKGGDDDIKCTLEARVDGRPNAAVTHHAASVDIAVEAAAEKLARMLEHQFAKLRDPSIH